ncbi:tRNA (adenine(37)-N6)-methyltransferase isoform X2 [Anopheles coustani]|nr:tRNA (adenine(37)-N6)-methyltransferase isoform X2 [Anopheles coustani]
MHTKELRNALKMLEDFRCPGCQQDKRNEDDTSVTKEDIVSPEESCSFKPIGVIRTVFNEKRAVPRQANLASALLSRIDISSTVFNNPSHSLEGLESFSHIWIIYHFHRNPNHLKAKVAPPRLGGERVGVFSTRSPHRPCPIGLSLVQLDRVEDSKVYFFGTDMVDGTPVLDIKPYIPQYDVPVNMSEIEFYNSREAPDGEETSLLDNNPSGSSTQPMSSVSVPNWVLNSSVLDVVFNTNAESQLQALGIEKTSIIDVLKADPRSVYLRSKYGSQFYTFRLGEHTVTCKFNDQNSSVTVLQIRDVVNFQESADECTAAKE